MMTTRGVETWKPIPGFSMYEASDLGQIRSIDRTVGGRRLKGRVLTPRVSNRGYALVNLTDDHRKPQTRTVHTLVLATFAGVCPPGQEARHLDDDPMNNAAVNLAWGSARENNGDKVRNGNRAGPRPPKVCVLCGGPFAGNGKRCHECVVWTGVEAARLLREGRSLEAACEQLKYLPPEGLHKLAVRYGGYGQRRSLRLLFVALRHRRQRGHRP